MAHSVHIFKNRPPFGVIGTLIITISLLSGCASEPPQLGLGVPKPQARHHNNLHKRAYNRPYRVKGKTYYPMLSAEGYSETGTASWYGSESGSQTAMGTHFSPDGFSAAHKTLPLPSKVRVTNLHNRRAVVLVVTDRGPFKKGRIIDLSHAAARRIGMRGVAKVKVEYLGSAD
ncbi:MAG: septal ring lytic transglycosylase RlpA family protein [Methylococcaceae bacterium]|nr:septal ring lytic transglycosylase RlpA family protein [Methylococcaceae bacterium]